MRIIFVCTGNTCRSPMAEKLFSHMTLGKDVDIASRGVMCAEGFPMNLNAKVVMREHGLDTQHSSKALTREDIESADLVIAMTASHKRYIEELFGASDKVHILGEYSGAGDVIDPYGGDIHEYRRCARRLESDLEALYNVLFDETAEKDNTSK